jgi:hypothetical protein
MDYLNNPERRSAGLSSDNASANNAGFGAASTMFFVMRIPVILNAHSVRS